MRKTLKTRVTKLLVLAIALSMIFMMELPVFAEEGALVASDDPRNSVMQISLGYEDDKGNFIDFKWGTCFLINDEYVLTNKHVVTLTDAEFNELKELVGNPNLKENDDRIKLYLYVNRDMKVKASVHSSVNSDDMDFAAVKLAEKIYGRKPIAIGDSDTIQTRDTIYAIGFPADSISNKEYNTKEDVSTVDGTISKVTVTGNIDIIEHTASLNIGNSGGPLLDKDNNVIGVNTFVAGKKNYSIQINAIKKGLDTFGIPYVDSGAAGQVYPVDQVEPEKPDNTAALNELTNAIDDAKKVEAKGYTEESIAALNSNIEKAELVVAQGADAEETTIIAATNDLNDAIKGLVEKKGPNMLLIGGIIAAVIIVIIIIIVVIVSSNNKKKAAKAKAMPAGSKGPREMPNPMPSIPTGAPMPSVDDGAGETTLLGGDGAGETSLLGGGSSAYLVRKKTGERVALNLQNFKIGKERRRVNYCVTDNATVSRLHCEIVKKGADYFVVDQGSANYTYVNGVQVSPHKETLLTDRSVLKLSDEEFEFHLS